MYSCLLRVADAAGIPKEPCPARQVKFDSQLSWGSGGQPGDHLPCPGTPIIAHSGHDPGWLEPVNKLSQFPETGVLRIWYTVEHKRPLLLPLSPGRCPSGCMRHRLWGSLQGSASQ